MPPQLRIQPLPGLSFPTCWTLTLFRPAVPFNSGVLGRGAARQMPEVTCVMPVRRQRPVATRGGRKTSAMVVVPLHHPSLASRFPPGLNLLFQCPCWFPPIEIKVWRPIHHVFSSMFPSRLSLRSGRSQTQVPDPGTRSRSHPGTPAARFQNV